MEQQPDLYSIEHGEKEHKERKLNTLDTSPAIDLSEEIKEARIALVGNDRLYQRFFDGIQDLESYDASRFSSVQNLFIEYCINLRSDEIEALVRQFNVGLSEYARKNMASIPPKYRDPLVIRDMKLNSKGIFTVLEFIRARKKLLEADPATKYTFLTEDILDAKYKIDILECIYDTSEGNTDNIHTMNLIQVKSSEPSDSEVRTITDGHRAWINSEVMDFEAFRREFTDGIPDAVTLKQITQNLQELSDILQEIYTEPGEFKPGTFVDRLKLEELTNKQRAWLLSDSVPIIKATIQEAVESGEIGAKEAAEFVRVLDELEKKVRSKAKLPRNITRVHSVNSIIAVGKQVVKETVLKSKSDNRDRDHVMKYN